MQPQAQGHQEVLDLFPHVGQVPLVVGEHEEIIDVTSVALDAQPVLDEGIERIEIDVGKELARLERFADGWTTAPGPVPEGLLAGFSRLLGLPPASVGGPRAPACLLGQPASAGLRRGVLKPRKPG
jgi:hypothetical protein